MTWSAFAWNTPGPGENQRDEYGFSYGLVPGVSFPDVSDAVVNVQLGFPIAQSWAVEGYQLGIFTANDHGPGVGEPAADSFRG